MWAEQAASGGGAFFLLSTSDRRKVDFGSARMIQLRRLLLLLLPMRQLLMMGVLPAAHVQVCLQFGHQTWLLRQTHGDDHVRSLEQGDVDVLRGRTVQHCFLQ